jgi:hypothetical protein
MAKKSAKKKGNINVRAKASFLTTRGVFTTGHGMSVLRDLEIPDLLWDNRTNRFFVAYVTEKIPRYKSRGWVVLWVDAAEHVPAPLHPEPFSTAAEADGFLKDWFVKNPCGKTAELLAMESVNASQIRGFLRAMGDGDAVDFEVLQDYVQHEGVKFTGWGGVLLELTTLGFFTNRREEWLSRVRKQLNDGSEMSPVEIAWLSADAEQVAAAVAVLSQPSGA